MAKMNLANVVVILAALGVTYVLVQDVLGAQYQAALNAPLEVSTPFGGVSIPRFGGMVQSMQVGIGNLFKRVRARFGL